MLSRQNPGSDLQLLHVELAKRGMTVVGLARIIGVVPHGLGQGLRSPAGWRTRYRIEIALGGPIFSTLNDYQAAERVSKILKTDVRLAHLQWLRKKAARLGRPEFLKADARPCWQQRLALIRALAATLPSESTPPPAGSAGAREV